MNWIDAKIVAHGKFDTACIPPQVMLPANVALVFYSRHGDPVIGDDMRQVERLDITTTLQAWLTTKGRSVSLFTDLDAALTSLYYSHTPKNYVVPPLGSCDNYRLSHLGTQQPAFDPRKSEVLVAEHAAAAGSIRPEHIEGPYFMPAPRQYVSLEFVVNHFLAPLAPAGGVAVGHCLFCRET